MRVAIVFAALVTILCAYALESDALRIIPRRYTCSIPGQRFYLRCKPCQRTCERPHGPCPRICLKGCGCPTGKVLKTTRLGWNRKQQCVNPSSCSTKRNCPIKGQIYYSGCKPCTGTCKNRHPICSKVCRKGCACPRGQVLKSTRWGRFKKPQCVYPTACPSSTRCPIKGQIYYSGCKPCTGTCTRPHVRCRMACRPGCACPRGKVLKRKGWGKAYCVRRWACKQKIRLRIG